MGSGDGAAAPVPRWLPWLTLGLAVAGLGVAAYLTVEHFTASTTLACPETSTVNCQKVTTSAQSAFLGIPVAVLGVLYFLGILPLLLPAAWRSQHRWLRLTRLGAAAAGVVFALYLVYAELFVINAICLWCTAVHVLAFALFTVIALGNALTARY
jgi:uncharacterized membrane protein